MEFETFLQQYGWLGFIAYIAAKEVLPFLRDKVYPQKMAQVKAERDRLQKLEERAIQNEERQTKALEAMNSMMAQFVQAITTNNERMAQLIIGHNEHARYMQDAINDMREKIASASKRRRKDDADRTT